MRGKERLLWRVPSFLTSLCGSKSAFNIQQIFSRNFSAIIEFLLLLLFLFFFSSSRSLLLPSSSLSNVMVFHSFDGFMNKVSTLNGRPGGGWGWWIGKSMQKLARWVWSSNPDKQLSPLSYNRFLNLSAEIKPPPHRNFRQQCFRFSSKTSTSGTLHKYSATCRHSS